jgi:hypothetical protein
MNKIWKWIGKSGKYVFRGLTVLLLVMALLAFVPGPVGQWGFNFWVSVDQAANALTFGDPDETISSRLGKWTKEEDVGWSRQALGHTICFFLDIVDENHCENSIEPEEGKNAVAQ